MSLSDEERKIVVQLELEKSKRIFSQIEGLSRLVIGIISQIDFITLCFMRYLRY